MIGPSAQSKRRRTISLLIEHHFNEFGELDEILFVIGPSAQPKRHERIPHDKGEEPDG